MRQWIGVFGSLAALTVFAASAPAAAQPYHARLSQAERQLRNAEPEERFPLASARCQTAITERAAQWMVVWCDLAATEAIRNRNRERRRDYSDAERALLWDAAWLQALEGIQDDSFFAAPLIERVSIADDVSKRRLAAYRLLSALRTRDYRDVQHYLRQLATLDGVSISPSETLLVGRRRLLESLLAETRTPERLWAIAATALTYELEYIGTGVTRDDLIADAQRAATLLAGLESEAESLTGPDAALLPLLLYAQAKVLWVARDFPGGQRVGETGYAACVARLWASASVCLDLGLEGGFARVLSEIAATAPEAFALPPEPPLSSRQRGVEYTEARCRVVIVGDVDDSGRFVNVRIAYENPQRTCRAMALSYANARRYRPINQATPGTRRQNHIIRFVLTSP